MQVYRLNLCDDVNALEQKTKKQNKNQNPKSAESHSECSLHTTNKPSVHMEEQRSTSG